MRLLLIPSAIAFLLSLVFPPSAAAQETATSCEPLAVAKREAQGYLAGSGEGELLVLGEEETKAYLGVVNATPPVTHLEGTGLLLLVHPKFGAVVGIIGGENVCVAGKIGTKVHEAAILKARGRGA